MKRTIFKIWTAIAVCVILLAIASCGNTMFVMTLSDYIFLFFFAVIIVVALLILCYAIFEDIILKIKKRFSDGK